MEHGFKTTSLWGAGITWADPERGAQIYSEPLSNALIILVGLMRAGFGVEPTLTDGLRTISSPMPQFEGAAHTFSFLGRNTTLHVHNGVTIASQSTAA